MKNMKKMYSRGVSFVAASLTAVGLIAVFGLSETAFAQSKEVRAVTDVLEREAAAVEKGDLAALDSIWANDGAVTIFEGGSANYGWADYRNNHLIPELKAFKNTKYALSDIRVKVDGKTAWATFKYALSADAKERKVDVNGIGTAVLEKQPDAGR